MLFCFLLIIIRLFVTTASITDKNSNWNYRICIENEYINKERKESVVKVITNNLLVWNNLYMRWIIMVKYYN